MTTNTAIFLMLRIDPILTLPIVIGVPAFYVLLKLLSRNIRPLAGAIRRWPPPSRIWSSTSRQRLIISSGTISLTRRGEAAVTMSRNGPSDPSAASARSPAW